MGVGYFFVWTVFGIAAYPLGVALAAVEMQQPALARAVPLAVGVVVLLVTGVMDLRAMAVVAAAIAVERLAPAGERAAGAIGAIFGGPGLFLIARAL